jgi:hypothetical protein
VADSIKVVADTDPVKQGERIQKRSRKQAQKRRKASDQKQTNALRKFAKNTRRAALIGGTARAASRVFSTDMWDEAKVAEHAAFQQFMDDRFGSAKASQLGRQDAKNAMAMMIGQMGYMSENAKELGRRMIDMRKAEEKGRNILRQDPDFAGPSMVDVTAAAATGYVKLVWEAFEHVEALFQE